MLNFRRIMRPLFQPLLIAALLSALFFGYQYRNLWLPAVQYSKIQHVPEKIWPVAALNVHFKAHDIKRTIFGQVVSEGVTKHLFRVEGCINQISPRLKIGAPVKKHETLIWLDPETHILQLETAKAQKLEHDALSMEIKSQLDGFPLLMKNSQASLDIAEAAFNRYQRLHQTQTISISQLEAAETTYQNAKAALDRLANEKAALLAKKETQLRRSTTADQAIKQAKLHLSHTEIKALNSGVVESFQHSVGDCVGPNTPAMTIVDPSLVAAKLELPTYLMNEQLSRDALPNLTLHVTDDLHAKNQIYQAQIDRIAPSLTPGLQSLDIYARFLPSQDNNLPPAGTFLKTVVTWKRVENALRVPSDAIFDGDRIYAIVDGRLQRRNAERITNIDGDILIHANVKDGELILISQLPVAIERAKVKVVSTQRAQ